MRRSSPWRRAPFVLLAIAAPAAHSWQTTIAVAPVGGQTSLATLGLLKQHCIDHKDVSVRAICSNAEEEEACQQAICGCRLRGGHAFSQLSTFPALSTHIAPPAEAESPCSRQDHGPPDCSCEHCLALKAALEGATTLVICADELHPRLMEVEGSLVVCSPLLASAQTGRSLRQALCLIDAAAAAGVRHIILHSSLGAGRDDSMSELQVARLGGSALLSARRCIEERLMEWVERSREDPAYVTMRYTILKAAPFATAAQLFERRTEMQQQVAGPLAVDEPRDGRAFLQGGALTAPGTHGMLHPRRVPLTTRAAAAA